MSGMHTNNDTGRNLEIPLRNDLRNEMEDNDEKSKCFGHLNHSDQRKRGLFNKILYRIAECIEIHVEVNNKFSALYKCVGDISRYSSTLDKHKRIFTIKDFKFVFVVSKLNSSHSCNLFDPWISF